LLIEDVLDDSDESPASPVVDAECNGTDRVNGADYWDNDADQTD
jgi:hypothetical protein